MKNIKVFIIDDHTIMREGLKALLSVHDDIEVVGEASNGKEGLIIVQELKPDVVIMDIAMPDMDGIEATRRIIKKNPNIKVLMLSQYDNKEYILSAVKAGAAGYINKKALSTELIAAIFAVHNGDSFLYPAAAAILIQDYRYIAESDDYDRLTAKEREILKLIAEGCTTNGIADKLVISPKTVMNHRTQIMEKLDIHNRTELIKYAMRKGLISIES